MAYRPRNRGTFQNNSLKFRYNRNQFIRSKEVRLIDSDGTNCGVVDTREALRMANEQELDLVEVAPKADPPVCRIMLWSKFLYEQKKKEKQSRKNKQKGLKEVRFGACIAEGDRDRLVNRVKKFLDRGHNVKITIKRKRRTPHSQSEALLKELLTLLSDYSTISSRPSKVGRWVSLMLHGKEGGTNVKSLNEKKNDAKTENKQNSSKKVQKDKTSRGKRGKDTIQQKQARSSKDKEIGTSEK